MSGDLVGRVVLVTGATGFIGSELVDPLRDVGAVVHGLGRLSSSSEWIRCDLSDWDAVRRVVGELEPDYVVHLAGRVSGDRSIGEVLPTLRTNLLGTVNLLAAVSEVGCRRIILAGSMEQELFDGAPRSPYAASKWAAAGYARMFSRLYGLTTVILRIHMVYGPGRQDDSKLVPYVVSSLLRGEQPALSSGGRMVDWVYIDDVIDAILRSLTAPLAGTISIDVGSGRLTSIGEVAELVSSLVGSSTGPRMGAIPDRAYEHEGAADVGPAADWLDWRAKTDLKDGLKKTIDWYRRQLGTAE